VVDSTHETWFTHYVVEGSTPKRSAVITDVLHLGRPAERARSGLGETSG